MRFLLHKLKGKVWVAEWPESKSQMIHLVISLSPSHMTLSSIYTHVRTKSLGKILFINASSEIKMSELIGEYASDYINMGESTDECQSYLNSACSAWNIAVLTEIFDS